MLQSTLVYKYLFKSLLLILLAIYLGDRFLDHVIILCIAFGETWNLHFNFAVDLANHMAVLAR